MLIGRSQHLSEGIVHAQRPQELPRPLRRVLGAIALVPATTSAVTAIESETYKQLDLFMDVFQRVTPSYVEKVDDDKLIKGAIDGMLASLDPHSAYLDARDFQNLRTKTDGNYGGLGLSVTMDDGAVKVISPTDDSPPRKAGIKAGDYITHLDGKLIYGGDARRGGRQDARRAGHHDPADDLPRRPRRAVRRHR